MLLFSMCCLYISLGNHFSSWHSHHEVMHRLTGIKGNIHSLHLFLCGWTANKMVIKLITIYFLGNWSRFWENHKPIINMVHSCCHERTLFWPYFVILFNFYWSFIDPCCVLFSKSIWGLLNQWNRTVSAGGLWSFLALVQLGSFPQRSLPKCELVLFQYYIYLLGQAW